MKFSIFLEHQLPRPWGPDSEYNLFQESLDQVELADKLGYDCVWEVEHHFLEEYSHSAQPEVFLAACSQRTKNIRLGHGIIHLTTNHPYRVAEKVASLDLVSNGRVEFGMGEGSSVTELHPFDRRFRDKRGIFLEAVQAIIPGFTQPGVEFKGEFFDLPKRAIIPKPLQKPHPPLWVACSQMDTVRDAGRWGFGALVFTFKNPEYAQAWVHAYYDEFLNNPDPICDYQKNPNVAVVNTFMCAETDEKAQEMASGSTFFEFALNFYNSHGPVEPGSLNLWDEFLEWKKTPRGSRPIKGLVGSPDTIRKTLQEYREIGIDQMILLNQAGKNTHEDICASLELFASEVMPEFHAAEAEHLEWKQKILNREIVLEKIDTDQFQQASTQTQVK